MSLWRFFDYCTEDGVNLIQVWYLEQDGKVRAAFDATVFVLGATKDWEDPKVKEFKLLQNRHAGLAELRFDIDVRPPRAPKSYKRRFRPVGIWRPEQRQFILLLGCEKTRLTYTPAGAFDTALKYKRQFEQGRGWIREHQ